MTISPLDTPRHFTMFPDLLATQRESLFSSLREFAERLRDTRAPTKAMLPLFSCCSFDSKRTSAGSLRHNANVRECFCIVGDYDRGQIPLNDAAEAMRRAGIAGVLVTTPSWTAAAPRWRVVVPLSDPLHRSRVSAAGLRLSDYGKLVSRLGGIFADAIHPESWTLSQSWYYGTTNSASGHQVVLIEGELIDLRADLDAAAIPKPTPTPKANPAAKPRAPRAPRPPTPQPSPGTTAVDDDAALVPPEIAELLAAISVGEGSHAALLTLTGKFAAQNMPIESAEEILLEAADQRPEAGRDPGWIKLRNDIPRVLAWTYAKETDTRKRLAAIIASASKREGNGTGNGDGAALVLPPATDTGSGSSASTGPSPGIGGAPPPPPSGGGPGPGAAPGAPPPQPGARTSVRGMIRDEKPRYAGIIANVITVLLNMPALDGCVAYDEMALQLVLCRALPGDAPITEPRPWTDADTTLLQDFLQRHAEMARVSQTTVDQGVEAFARKYHRFHPVRAFLAAQQWDGVKRLNTWLPTYIGTADNEYTRGIGHMWLIGMVARIEEPGCQFDYMLILEGPQGVGKSSVACALCDPWTTDQVDLRQDSRMVSQTLRGVWLAEVAELSAFRHAEIELLKSFITRRIEHYVPRYAARAVTEPRQCGLMGTTNRTVYLDDATGMRRGWPVKVGTIELDKLRADRGQLWAEALVAFRAREPWHPTPAFEAKYLKPEQDERYDEDGWTPLVADYVEQFLTATAAAQKAWDKQPPGVKVPKDRPQVRLVPIQVYREALTSPTTSAVSLPHFGKREAARMADILERLGWERGRKTGSHRWWVPVP